MRKVILLFFCYLFGVCLCCMRSLEPGSEQGACLSIIITFKPIPFQCPLFLGCSFMLVFILASLRHVYVCAHTLALPSPFLLTPSSPHPLPCSFGPPSSSSSLPPLFIVL
ncbi:hypothetical protein F5H01DRAFT_348508 [Linnemannia elongata]|nr:hypothetical protein F5H01DRAFT_348508 [Linnemannia elongata]